MKGVFVNFLAIIVGAFLGLLMKQGIPSRYKKTIMQALRLAVFLIGIKKETTFTSGPNTEKLTDTW